MKVTEVLGNIAKTKKVQTHLEGISTLASLIGDKSRIVVVETMTEPKLKYPKTNPLSGRIKKKQRFNAVIGFSYSSSVNRRLKKQNGKKENEQRSYFSAIARPYISNIEGSPLIQHNGLTNPEKRGTVYLPLNILRSYTPQYFIDACEVSYDEVKEYLQSKKKKSNIRQNGLKNPVVYTNVLWNNVTAITGVISGQTIRFQS